MRGYLIIIIFILLISSISAVQTLEVIEGKLVKLKLAAFDSDGDPLNYTFTSPLNENGEWQTKAGDAGEYPITITVSDGKSETKQDLIIVVKENVTKVEVPEIKEEIKEMPEEKVEEKIETPIKKNNPPKLEKIKDIEVMEGDLVKIVPVATDEDNDQINYGFAYPLNENGEWQTKAGDAGEYIITVTATDGQSIDSRTFKITVKKKIEEINFKKINNIEIKENEEANVRLDASSEESIEFSAETLPEGATLSGNVFRFNPDQNYVGRNIFVNLIGKFYPYVPKKSKTITFIAKTRNNEKKQDVKLTVIDVNRAPTLEINNVVVNEVENIKFNPITKDEDGDWLKVKYSGKIKNNYRTTIDDSGTYTITAAVSDPFTSFSKDFNIIVNNVNREPFLQPIDFKKINENEELKIELVASDPDNDKLTYYIKNAQKDAKIEGNVFSWKPGYDFVDKETKTSWINRIKYFNKKVNQNNKEIVITIGVGDGNLTNEKSFNVVVYDINRAPEIIKSEPKEYFIVARGAKIIFSIDAMDSDNDKLTYKWNFGIFNNLEAENAIARTFNIKGVKTIKVRVSDGVDEVEKVWNIKVI